MPDVRPKIHRPTTSPIKSRLKSVLDVRSSYVERNKLPGLGEIRADWHLKTIKTTSASKAGFVLALHDVYFIFKLGI